MPKRLTQEDVISRIRAIHGEKFDCSELQYKNSSTKVVIACNDCGYKWKVVANSLLMGHGCPRCTGTERHTTESYIELAKSVHGDKYTYEKTKYTKSGQNVTVTCGEHGDFETNASDHVRQGYGCKKCADKANGLLQRGTREEFIAKALLAHPNGNYDYSKVIYQTSHTPVEIICKEHGTFSMSPIQHTAAKQGCVACGTERRAKSRRLKLSDFVARSEIVHNMKYSYVQVDFSGVKAATDKVDIVCPDHGVFSQTITDHMHAGAGCPQCSVFGFKTNTSGKLYIMSCGSMTKVGITNLDVYKRARHISQSCGEDFSVLNYFHFQDGAIASNVETEMLRSLRKTYKGVSEVFDGYTECFHDVDRNKLLADIVQMCSKHLPTY